MTAQQMIDPQPQMNTRVEKIGSEFVESIRSYFRDPERKTHSLPTIEEREYVASQFWTMVDQLDEIEQAASDVDAVKARFVAIVGPILFRSRPFWHCYFKPHGYSGDFDIIEQIYDMEEAVGVNPYQSLLTNCLDYAFSLTHSVVGVWERRAWLQRELRGAAEGSEGRLRIADVACGGARYLEDFLLAADDTDEIEITLFDQDPAALQFAFDRIVAVSAGQVNAIHGKIADVESHLLGKEFDVVISSGLFDNLEPGLARETLTFFNSLLSDHGSTLITNFSTLDRSQVTKRWVGNWDLVFRDEQEMKSLFPANSELELQLSLNHSLWLAKEGKRR